MNVRPSSRAADTIFIASLRSIHAKTDVLFLWLLMCQWILAIVLALTISPYAWEGAARTIHTHVITAVLAGAVLNALPAYLIILHPGRWVTRHVVAASQMLWSALLIHLTGGLVETHFHIFGSLAFLAMYRDWRVLVTASAVVLADHLARGFWWPESIYGVLNPEWWRLFVHVAWVLFEDIVLFFGCQRGLQELRRLADREAALESAKASVEEVVEQRTAELKATGDKYRLLVENTSAIPWELSRATGASLYVAPQIRKIFGMSTDDSASIAFVDCFHAEDRTEFMRFIRTPGNADSVERNYIDCRVMTDDKSIRHIRSFIAMQSESGVQDSVCGISVDITHQKQLESDLAQAQKLESIGQLSAGIAHEINTPTQFISNNVSFVSESMTEIFGLIHKQKSIAASTEDAGLRAAAITAAMEAADFNYLQEEVPRAIAQSIDGLDRIKTIVAAMKEFSHPAVERTALDINRAISSTIIVASNEWKYVADLNTDFDADLPQIPVMPGAFNQVILNMIVNAAHAVGDAAVGKATIKGLITISTRRVDEWVEIRITDTGCGIPSKIRDRIFDPFFTTKAVGKGTGQGLAIAHDVVVKRHGGTIEVESEPGKGTTFIVRLPLIEEIHDVAA